MMPYVLVERGVYKTRKGEFPFAHYFERPGPFFNVITSKPEKAKEFLTIHSAKRMIKERGLHRFKPERVFTRRDGPVLREGVAS